MTIFDRLPLAKSFVLSEDNQLGALHVLILLLPSGKKKVLGEHATMNQKADSLRAADGVLFERRSKVDTTILQKMIGPTQHANHQKKA